MLGGQVHAEWTGGGLAELAREMLREGPGWAIDGRSAGAAASVEGRGIVLSLEDLVTDEGGACVLDGDGIDLSVMLETDDAVVAQGLSEPHAIAAGADVSGHAFIAFASGVTLYFPSEIEVAIAAPGA